MDITKIKNLVQTSPILSPSERSEWMVLLGLMSERQLQELENILSLGKPLPQVSAVSKPTAKSVTNDLPALSHIMNLPHSGPEETKDKKQPINAVTPESLVENVKKKQAMEARVLAQKKFSDNIKSMLSEKELPAPQIPFPKNQVQNSEPKTVIQADTINIVLKDKDQAELKKPASALAQPAVSQMPAKVTFPAEKVAPAFVKKPAPVSPQPDFKAGVDLSKAFTKPSQETLNTVKQSIQREPAYAHPAALKSVRPYKPGFIGGLESVQSLETLTAAELHDWDAEAAVNKIRDLISRSSYFDVVVNIEKSPLYKNYITTGFRLLNQDKSFEQNTDQKSRDFLSREEFEKFADILQWVQAS